MEKCIQYKDSVVTWTSSHFKVLKRLVSLDFCFQFVYLTHRKWETFKIVSKVLLIS